MSTADSRALEATAGQADHGRGEIWLVLAVGLLLVLLILPLPTRVLDVLLAANITLTLLVLFNVLATPAPREFTAFPSLLLFLTLFRLGLNVASARLILLKGDAGRVIEAFGNYVVGGNLVVGMIIFAILLIVQFVVITKGAGRISEVAARFTLDGLPGKQMAIDADLNAGVITGEEASGRRRDLMKESEFYGAMDGASKFVRGDAIAALVITVVNLVGGGVMGLMQGMDLASAAHRYSILSVGDGLVAQVPALVVSTAGALLVTKSSSAASLSSELAVQLFTRWRTFMLVAAATLLLGLMPGLPTLPFLLLAAAVFVFGRLTRKKQEDAKAAVETKAPAPRAEPQQIEELLQVDRVLVEVGYRLVGLVNSGPSGGLLERIAGLRKRFAADLGIVLPPIRVRDSAAIDPRGYRVLLSGETVAEGELSPGSFLAMPPSGDANSSPPIEGVLTRDPTFGLPALWVRDELRAEAEAKGYTVIDAASVLATHLAEVIRDHAHEILTRDDTRERIEQLKKTTPALVEEVTPQPLAAGEVHRVLKNLLRENVSIKNLAPIFEALADHAGRVKDPDLLAEFARERLARTLTNSCADSAGVLRVVTLDPGIEQRLADLAGDPNALGSMLRQVADRVKERVLEALSKGFSPVVVVRPTLRRVLALQLLELKPRVAVLSYNEISGVKRIEPVGSVGQQEELAVTR